MHKWDANGAIATYNWTITNVISNPRILVMNTQIMCYVTAPPSNPNLFLRLTKGTLTPKMTFPYFQGNIVYVSRLDITLIAGPT